LHGFLPEEIAAQKVPPTHDRSARRQKRDEGSAAISGLRSEKIEMKEA
jgi:hypothetical protein